MAEQGSWQQWLKWGAAAALAGAVGCSKDTSKVEVTTKDAAGPAIAANIPNEAKPTDPMAPAMTLDPALHQPFEQACTNEIPADSPIALPPDLTSTGKRCGQLNDQVARIWDQIKFQTPDGKRQTYVAEIEVAMGETSLGIIEMVMQPELAPNHARNFVALASLEYYDGLRFDRIVKQQYEGEGGQMGKLVLLEAGSPLESAEPERSHLGYWVKPEFRPEVKHEEGSVGACLLSCESNEETAAVRFYMNLTPAPAMDGRFTIFAKVTKGLDVARRVAEQPNNEEPGPEQGKPKQPIAIRKVTVRAVPVVQ